MPPVNFLDLCISAGFRTEPAIESKKAPEKPPNSSFSSLIQSSVKTMNWIIENRAGFAWLLGLIIVPSQFLGPEAMSSNQIIANAAKGKGFKIERFSLPIQGSNTSVEGIIYYPENWNPEDHSRCVLYHNPNAITVSGYFGNGCLFWTPAEILELAKCPIMMYDYRGTSLSDKNGGLTSLATYETIAVDGETTLKHALQHFQSVSVIGSSLGGGVATVSLDRHLKTNPEDASRVSLINHDSFSTTPKVVLPGWPRVANWTGWALGGLLDAETSMKNLAGKGIPITVLCHTQDPVIPHGARMAEFIETLPCRRTVSIIYSPEYDHANLSQKMISKLEAVLQPAF